MIAKISSIDVSVFPFLKSYSFKSDVFAFIYILLLINHNSVAGNELEKWVNSKSLWYWLWLLSSKRRWPLSWVWEIVEVEKAHSISTTPILLCVILSCSSVCPLSLSLVYCTELWIPEPFTAAHLFFHSSPLVHIQGLFLYSCLFCIASQILSSLLSNWLMTDIAIWG